MKIKNRRLLYFAGRVAAALVRVWFGTCRAREHIEDPPYNPFLSDGPKVFYSAWHEALLVTAWRYGRMGATVLISKSDDGQLIAGGAVGFGWNVIRGSSSRGAAGALRAVLQLMRKGGRVQIAFTPDGPRGPRQEFKIGLVYLASRTGVPIVPTGTACSHSWRAKSWDRLILPRPFSRIEIYHAAAVAVPKDANEELLESYRRFVEAEMVRATANAERKLRGEAAVERTVSAPPLAA